MPRRPPSVPESSVVAVRGALARRDAIALVHGIRSDLQSLASLFWDIGHKLRALRDDEAFRKLGYADFTTCVEAELGISLRQAEKMMAVVHWYARADATAVGLERASALITYSRAVGGDADPGALIRDNAAIDGIPVREASSRHIKAAATIVRKTRALKQARTPAARASAREQRALVRAVRAQLAATALPAARVSIEDGHLVMRIAVKAVARRFA